MSDADGEDKTRKAWYVFLNSSRNLGLLIRRVQIGAWAGTKMEVLSAITENAAQHVTWALTLLGGTLLTIVGTSHVSPSTTGGRLMYLLFIPAWALLAVSIHYGDRVQRHAISIRMVDAARVRDIHAQINTDFQSQLSYLKCAGFILVLWLILYVVWWVFCRSRTGES